MSEVKSLSPGHFCWVDLAVSNAKTTYDFFSALFGWKRRVRPTPSADAYSIMTSGNSHVVGVYEVAEEGPSQWMSYILVEDLAIATKKAVALGAKAIEESIEIETFGTMAVLQDPVGALFALWQTQRGESTISGNGTVCWNELLTDDQPKAEQFYTKLFGWTAQKELISGEEYTRFWMGEERVGGMMGHHEKRGSKRSHWLVHFAVDDCDATIEKALELGGKLRIPAKNHEKIGREAVLRDPSGGSFGILELADELKS